jgi:DNA-binding protein H-NS
MAIDLKGLNHTQLADLIQKAEQRQHELVAEKGQKVRAKILAMVKAEGLDFDEVMGRRSKGRVAKSSKVKPKYRNPADPSQQWSGRGRQPLWYAAAVKAGKKEKDLLIG